MSKKDIQEETLEEEPAAKQEQAETAKASDDSSADPSLEQQLTDEKRRRLQVMADFDNYRKRMESERSTFGALANIGIIQEILEIFDDLQLAMNDDSLEIQGAKQAITTAQEKLKAAASHAGVVTLDINQGDEFDSSVMEAVTTIPDADNAGKVVAVISSGFKYASKEGVIKPAKVVIGK